MRYFSQFRATCKTLLIAVLFLHQANVSKAQTAFTCQDQISYITRNASSTATTLPYTLYAVNLITGTETSLGAVRNSANANLRVNGIGYNTVDNFIWGSQPGTSNILKIGSNGIAQSFPVTNLPASEFNAGDVDAAGNLYLYVASASTIYKINLTGPTYSATAITVTGSNLGDFSVSADGTKIYGVSAGNGDLVVYTLSGSTSSRVATDIGFSAANFASFMDSRGNMFIKSHTTGDVYLLDPTDATVGTPKKVYVGTAMTNADGAQCRTASVYSNTQPAFGCQPGQGYVMQSTAATSTCSEAGDDDLYTVDVQTGAYEEFYPNMTGGLTYGILNNLGYNPTDGFLWAYRFGTNQLVRIGSDKTIQFFPIDGLPARCASGFSSGDFDQNGVFYLIDALSPTEIHKVDLNPASANYLKHTGPVPITISGGPLSDLADVAFNPADGMLYGVSNSRNLIRLNPSTGAATNLGPTSIGGTTNIVIAFIDVTGTLYVQAGNSANVYRISDVQQYNGTTNPTASVFKSNSPTTSAGDGAICSLTLFAGVSVSGNIWDDANGDRIKTENNTVTDNTSETLTMYLLDENNTVVGKSDVATDGTWRIDLVPPGAYSAHLSNHAAMESGTKNAAIPATLPEANWVHTGINFGNTPGQAGTSSGAITVNTTDVTNLNFGIEQRPAADSKSYSVPYASFSSTPSGGSAVPGYWGIPANSSAMTGYPLGGSLTGSDREDCPTAGSCNAARTFIINTIKTNTKVFYNGVEVTSNSPISNFDVSKLYIYGQIGSGDMEDPLSFTYSLQDAAGFTNVEPATYQIISSAPLPVRLVSFEAVETENTALLRWQTTMESNASHFEVERSTDAKRFEKIGQVKAAGESNSLQKYTFTDAQFSQMPTTVYYRLRSVDLDGTFALSAIRVLTPQQVWKVYPNPVQKEGNLTVQANAPITGLALINISGGEVPFRIKARSGNTAVLDMRAVPAGMYTLRISTGNGVTGSKIVVE